MSTKQLPGDVLIVESPLSWIHEVLSPLGEEVAAKKLDIYKDYLLKEFWGEKSHANDNRKHTNVDEATNVRENLIKQAANNLRTLFSFLSVRLKIVAVYSYSGEFLSAEIMLKRLYRCLAEFGTLEDLKFAEEYLKAIQFAVDTAKYQISILKSQRLDNLENSSSNALTEEEDMFHKERIIQNWKTFLNNGKFMATMNFLEGEMKYELGTKDDSDAFKHCQKSVDLDPDCYLWYRFAYKASRAIRRNSNEKYWKISVEEGYFCNVAQELGKDEDIVVDLDVAVYLKESLHWYNYGQPYFDRENAVQDCMFLFNKVIEFCNENHSTWANNDVLKDAKIYYADFVLFSKEAGNFDQNIGKILLEELLESYPENEEVLHKMAKLYHRGASGTFQFKDVEKAEEFYLKSLEISPENYPCLMAYLLLQFDRKQYGKLIGPMDIFLQKSWRDKYSVNVSILKGFIVWLFNPSGQGDHKKEAMDIWIGCLVKFPENTQDAYNAFRKPPVLAKHFFGSRNNQKEFNVDVMREMKEIYELCVDLKEKEVIGGFLEELNKSENVTWRSSSTNETKARKYVPPHRRQRTLSEADSDDFWRQKT